MYVVCASATLRSTVVFMLVLALSPKLKPGQARTQTTTLLVCLRCALIFPLSFSHTLSLCVCMYQIRQLSLENACCFCSPSYVSRLLDCEASHAPVCCMQRLAKAQATSRSQSEQPAQVESEREHQRASPPHVSSVVERGKGVESASVHKQWCFQ